MKSNKVNWMVLSRRPLPLLTVHVLQLVSPFSSYFPPNVVAELSSSLWDESMQGQTRHSTLLCWADLRASAEGECYKFCPLAVVGCPWYFIPAEHSDSHPAPRVICYKLSVTQIPQGGSGTSLTQAGMVGHLNNKMIAEKKIPRLMS